MFQHKLIQLTFLAVTSLTMLSCSSGLPEGRYFGDGAVSSLPERPESIMATNWTKLEIRTFLYNSMAMVTMDSTGHYHSDWAVCTRKPYGVSGVLTEEEWKELAPALNALSEETQLSSNNCFGYDSHASRVAFSDEAWLYIPNEKRSILKVDSGGACSSSTQTENTRKVLNVISTILKKTVQADCPPDFEI